MLSYFVLAGVCGSCAHGPLAHAEVEVQDSHIEAVGVCEGRGRQLLELPLKLGNPGLQRGIVWDYRSGQKHQQNEKDESG